MSQTSTPEGFSTRSFGPETVLQDMATGELYQFAACRVCGEVSLTDHATTGTVCAPCVKELQEGEELRARGLCRQSFFNDGQIHRALIPLSS